MGTLLTIDWDFRPGDCTTSSGKAFLLIVVGGALASVPGERRRIKGPRRRALGTVKILSGGSHSLYPLTARDSFDIKVAVC